MAKSKKVVKAKPPRKLPVKFPAIAEGDLFTIEENPPPIVRGLTPEKAALFEKLDRTLLGVKYGQAFIIPTVHRNTIEKYLRDTYGITDRFSYQKIHDNLDVIRVYRLPYDKKAKR